MTLRNGLSIVERPLGDSATDHVRSRLAKGKTLSRRVARRWESLFLETTGLIPAGVSDEQAHEFRGSVFQEPPKSAWVRIEGGWAVPKGDTTPELAGLVHEFLEAAADRIAVFENFLSKPTDPGLSEFQSRMWFFDEEVYHYCVHGDSRADIERAINESFHAVFFRGFLVIPSEPLPARSPVLDEEVLDSLAACTLRSIVAAYDAESFLLSRPAERGSGEE